MPGFKEDILETLEKNYNSRETTLDKMKYMVQFARSLADQQYSPLAEEPLNTYFQKLANEICDLSPSQQAQLGKEWGEYIAGKQINVSEYFGNLQDKNALEFNEDCVISANSGRFMDVLKMNAPDGDLPEDFFEPYKETVAFVTKDAWKPNDPDMAEAEKEKIYRQRSEAALAVVSLNVKALTGELGVGEDVIEKAFNDAQKKADDTLSPDITSVKRYGEELEKLINGLSTDLPGDPGPLKEAAQDYTGIVNAYFRQGVESFVTKENILRTLSPFRLKFKERLDNYLKDVKGTAITNEQQTALLGLDRLARPILRDGYEDYKNSIVTKPGYEVCGANTYQARKGTYGSFARYYKENVWVDEYVLSHTKRTPQSVTLPDGRKGTIYPGEKFNLKEELQKVVNEITERKPELAPYLQLNDDAIDAVMKATPDNSRALTDFTFAFRPDNVSGANEKYKTQMAMPSLESYFVPVEEGKPATIPEFQDELEGLFEKFYALSCDQNELMHGRLLNEKGEGLPTEGATDAMGEVADLLGISGILAPSERIPIEKDGSTTYVSFKEKVQGKRITDPEKDNIFLDKKNNPMMTPEVLKSLADMQLLDYICGTEYYNMDSGLVFKTDPENPTKITGIVREETGNAFGTIDPQKVSSGKRADLHPSTMIHPDKLMVINSDTAEKVKAMTAEDMTRIMQNKGFTPQQIEAANLRLQQVKDKLNNPSKEIKSGSIHIMTDEEWKAKPVSDIMRDLVMDDADKEKYKTADEATKTALDAKLAEKESLANDNIFRKIYGVREMAKNAVGMEKEVNGEVHPSREYTAGFRGKVELAKFTMLSMKDMLTEIERNDPWYTSSSKEYKEMKSSVKEYVETYDKVSKLWEKDPGRKSKDVEKLTHMVQDIKNKARAYRQKKDTDGITGYSGPGRYAAAQRVERFAGVFEKQLNRDFARSENDRRIDNIREYYGKNGLDPSLVPLLTPNKIRKGEEKIIKPVEVPSSKPSLRIGKDDFMFTAYVSAFVPEISGQERKAELGITDEELSPEENVSSVYTMFTLDLSLENDSKRPGEYTPRDNVGKYFPTIQRAREEAAGRLQEAAQGNPAGLGKLLAQGMEEYVKYCIDNCADPTAESVLVNDRMMKGALDFLEKNPEVMQAATDAGLKRESILKIKAKAKFAEMYDRCDIARQRLKRAEEGRETLTEKQKADCRADISAYENIKAQVKKEVAQQISAIPGRDQRLNALSDELQTQLTTIAASEAFKRQEPDAKKAFDKAQYLISAKMETETGKGIGLPKTIQKLEFGLEKMMSAKAEQPAKEEPAKAEEPAKEAPAKAEPEAPKAEEPAVNPLAVFQNKVAGWRKRTEGSALMDANRSLFATHMEALCDYVNNDLKVSESGKVDIEQLVRLHELECNVVTGLEAFLGAKEKQMHEYPHDSNVRSCQNSANAAIDLLSDIRLDAAQITNAVIENKQTKDRPQLEKYLEEEAGKRKDAVEQLMQAGKGEMDYIKSADRTLTAINNLNGSNWVPGKAESLRDYVKRIDSYKPDRMRERSEKDIAADKGLVHTVLKDVAGSFKACKAEIKNAPKEMTEDQKKNIEGLKNKIPLTTEALKEKYKEAHSKRFESTYQDKVTGYDLKGQKEKIEAEREARKALVNAGPRKEKGVTGPKA